VKVLGGGREVADLHVLLGAQLKKAFQAATGMFRPLTFVTVRQQQYDPAGTLPFRFRRGDELVDDGAKYLKLSFCAAPSNQSAPQLR
jgi:hypothetical protein